MIRKIVDYQKLNEDILNLLVEKFPDGYDDTDIISFRNAQNEIIEAVEVRTDDTIYLVKVGKRLVQAMEDFSDDDDDVDVDDDAAEVDFEDVKVEDDDVDEDVDVVKKDDSSDGDNEDDSDYDDQEDTDYDEDEEDDDNN